MGICSPWRDTPAGRGPGASLSVVLAADARFHHTGSRRFPTPGTGTLVTAMVALLLGGLAVSVAAELEDDEPAPTHGAAHGAAATR